MGNSAMLVSQEDKIPFAEIVDDTISVLVYGKVTTLWMTDGDSATSIPGIGQGAKPSSHIAQIFGVKYLGACHNISPPVLLLLPAPDGKADGSCGFGTGYFYWRLSARDSLLLLSLSQVTPEGLVPTTTADERGLRVTADGQWDGDVWTGDICIKWTETIAIGPIHQEVTLINACREISLKAEMELVWKGITFKIRIKGGNRLCVRAKVGSFDSGEYCTTI